MPAKEELPSTIKRSPAKAQRTWSKAHDSAVAEYGEGQRAHRTAFGALKHSFEKVGDRWQPKAGGAKGPSDKQSRKSGAAARRGGPTAEGVDANAPVGHLRGVARKLGIPGRSAMRKQELVDAIKKANRRKTSRARNR